MIYFKRDFYFWHLKLFLYISKCFQKDSTCLFFISSLSDDALNKILLSLIKVIIIHIYIYIIIY